LKWASPTQYQPAWTYQRSNSDIGSAKRLLYEILDGEDCIDPATDLESESVPYLARCELAEIIFEEFRAASSLKLKEALLQEIEGLSERRLGQSF
jgi:hypothetical protein